MTTIVALAQDQVLTATTAPKLACNNRNTVKLRVTFSTEWQSFTARSAVFTTSVNPTPYEAVLANGECTIPHEVLEDAGLLYIYVKGVNASTNSVKTTTPIAYKVQPGTPSLIVSEPTANVYQQLLTQIATMHSRLSTAEAAVTVDSEVQGIRTGADGTKYPTAGDAVRGQTATVPTLASFILGIFGEVVIDANEETITFPDDTLIIGYNGKHYQLSDGDGNTSCSFAMSTTAVNIVYQITTGKIYSQAYHTAVDRRDNILLCSIRRDTIHLKVSITCNYTLIKDGVRYNNLALSEGTRRSSFLAPLITGLVDKYAVIDTTSGTITFPDDTLIIDPCGGIGGTDVTYQLSKAKGNTVCKYTDYTQSSAVKIFYNPATDALEAAQYNIYNNAHIGLILLATIRTSNKAVATNIPYVYDGLLNGVDYSEWAQEKNTNTVKAINHRGFADAPENTLSAFRLSKKKGFAYVECDVSFTSDGVAVLLHDSTVDRTSNGTGNIAEMTFSAVRSLDFGSWKSEEYAGEQIPTFEEFIVLCKRLGLHPYIEVKTGTETQIKGLYDTVRLHGMKDKVTWISFNSAYLGYIREVDTKARLGYVVDAVDSGVIASAKKLLTAYNEVFIDCAGGNANESTVKLCADADLPLEVWTVNTESAILALNGYVSGVTSDNIIAGKVLANSAMSK